MDKTNSIYFYSILKYKLRILVDEYLIIFDKDFAAKKASGACNGKKA